MLKLDIRRADRIRAPLDMVLAADGACEYGADFAGSAP